MLVRGLRTRQRHIFYNHLIIIEFVRSFKGEELQFLVESSIMLVNEGVCSHHLHFGGVLE